MTTPPPIKGYRELTAVELALINEVKDLEADLMRLIEKVNTLNSGSAMRPFTVDSESYRWAAIAKTDLQTGLMALTRAISKPIL